MNAYRISYRNGEEGVGYIKADSFIETSDFYHFQHGGEIVAAISKAMVVSVEMVKEAGGG